MKLAITPTDLFPFGVQVTALEMASESQDTQDLGTIAQTSPQIGAQADLAGFRVQWMSATAAPTSTTLDITEAYVRERCGAREISDASNIYLEMDTAGQITRVHNKMASTLTEKSNGYEYALKNATLVAAQIYIPFADSPTSDWVLRVNGNPNIATHVPAGTVVVEHSLHAFHAFAQRIYPWIQVLSVQATDQDVYELTLQLMQGSEPSDKAGVRIFASSASGYVNRREVHTDAQGQARLKARRLDLAPSDAMRVELGFKFTTNLCHVDIPQP